MSRFGFQRHQIFHDSTISSTYTSNPYLTVDFATLSVSWKTNTATASFLTIQATNDDGLTSALVEGSWSNLTAVPAQGMFTIDPGPRWIRMINPSADSLATLILEAWTG